MTSASTLIRRAKEAEKKGHKFAAKRLREQAAAMRRKDRKKEKEVPSIGMTVSEVAAAMNRNMAPNTGAAVQSTNPLDEACDRVLGAGNGSPEQRIALRRELVDARVIGRKEFEDRWRDEFKITEESHRINVVSGFMATIEASEKLNNGALPVSLTIAGYTAAQVYDALRKAGYSSRGLVGGGIARENIARPAFTPAIGGEGRRAEPTTGK